MGKLLDLSGKRFGRLTVLRKVQVEGARNAMWECRCDCGNLTVGAGPNLGKTKFSCGCMQSENGRRVSVIGRAARPNQHGESQGLEFRSWASMKGRCLNPKNKKYPRYGGRGIKVCDRWLNSFENFLIDMGRRPSPVHSIDRINNDGDYEPGNCHWATTHTQTRNRRTTRLIEINGQSLCVRDWEGVLGVGRGHFYEMCREFDSEGRPKKRPFRSVEKAARSIHRERFG